tara:strand:- start:233 stop:592 length:360 start_codon:yes stop_codon:yes gene_type:complete
MSNIEFIEETETDTKNTLWYNVNGTKYGIVDDGYEEKVIDGSFDYIGEMASYEVMMSIQYLSEWEMKQIMSDNNRLVKTPSENLSFFRSWFEQNADMKSREVELSGHETISGNPVILNF